MNILKNRFSISVLVGTLFAIALSSCNSTEKTGWEFAPNMYNSIAYEAQTQYRSNSVNPNGMNMRMPVEGTVSRRNYNTEILQDDGTLLSDLMVYSLDKDSLSWAAENLVNPIPWSGDAEDEGKVLYERNCSHCHGEKGAGNGKVGVVYKGVPSYSSAALSNVSGGHIYHVITYGKGRMWPHAAQVLPEERWKIVHYVQRLQLGI
ncbi:MAG: cytochrome c [Algoriphagus sp.]|jgi:cytochrome c